MQRSNQSLERTHQPVTKFCIRKFAACLAGRSTQPLGGTEMAYRLRGGMNR